MPLPEKLDTVPPEIVKSDKAKLVDVSLRVKVNVAVSPTPRLDLLLLTAIVGAVVSAAAEIDLAAGLTDSE